MGIMGITGFYLEPGDDNSLLGYLQLQQTVLLNTKNIGRYLFTT